MGASSSDKKQKFSHETKLDHAGLIALLEGLLAGLREGELVLEHGARAVTLRPHGPIEVSLEAKHKPERETLCLELEWVPERVEPKLRVGPNEDPAPISTRRKSVVALRQLRASEVAPEPEVSVPDDLELTAEMLMRLPKERLYALAKLAGLDGRSQLHKSALARALAGCELRAWLDEEDRRMLHGRAE